MGLYISASGIVNALRRNDVTANNVANWNTTGYRAARATSSEASGGGSQVSAITRNEGSGGIAFTGNPLDVAATDGFFQVRRDDGSTAYTRDGHFGLNAQGEVVTANGDRLDPPVTVPTGASDVRVGRDGTVTATLPGALGPQAVGQIAVFSVPNPAGLQAEGNNLYATTPASGAAQVVQRPELLPGALPASNVDLATERVNQILDQRSFEANLNAFRAQDDTLGELLNLIE